MAAKHVDVRFVPGFDRVGPAVPAFCTSAIKVVDIPQVIGEVLWITRRPRRRNMVYLKYFQPHFMLNAHGPFVPRVGRPSTAGGFDLRPTGPVAYPPDACKPTKSTCIAYLLRVGIEPGHSRIDCNRRTVDGRSLGDHGSGYFAGAIALANLKISDGKLS